MNYMKRFFVLMLVCSLVVAILCACGNKDVFDTVYTFDRCIIELPNGEIIKGDISSWKDYEGDQIQVEINGVYYLVHSSNIVLISD